MTHPEWFTKEQAAHLIRCSMETVEQLAAVGKLEQQMRPRPGRPPRPVYNSADVLREIAERAEATIEQHIFTPAEAAVYAKRSVAALRKLQLQGKLPNADTGPGILYRRADLDELSGVRR